MSLQTFLVHDVAVITPGSSTDRYGQTVRDWDTATTVSTRGWVRQRSSVERDEGRDVVTTLAVVFLRPDVAIDAGCRVQALGRLYDVDAAPVVAHTPAGAHHLEAALREVEG